MKETIIQKTHEKGQALMELAVSITVLFIIVAGVVDIGRMLFHYITMRDAAQEAAAYGSIYPTHCDQIRDRAWIAMASSPL
jgi:Flp pilus assembly protein TadG